MKTNIQETSLFAYEQIKPHLNKMQERVYIIISSSQAKRSLTAKEISIMLNKPINSIVPRLNELMFNKQMIKIVKRENKESYYAVRNPEDQLNVKKLTPHEKLEQVKTWLRGQGVYVETGKAIKIINKIIDEL